MRPRLPPARADRWPLAIALAVPAVLWLMAWPFAGEGVNDDFSYAFTAKRLAETGRFTYNGWSTAMLGPQAVWAAIFIRAFGFSHDLLRATMLPISLACAGLTYALHRRLRVPPRWSLFATLALVASPLFTPWSCSFMTDVPGLAFTLAFLHAVVSLVRAEGRAARAGWAFAIVAIGLAGGSIRQTNLVLAGVALTIVAIRRRREWPIELGVGLLLHAVAAVALLRWSARQPYATPESPFVVGSISNAAFGGFGLAATLGLCLVPLGVAMLPLAGVARATIAQLAAASVVACAASVALAPNTPLSFAALGLWAGNTMTATGVTADGLDAPGVRPVVFGVPTRVAMAAATYWIGTVGAVALWRRRRTVRAAIAGSGSRRDVVAAFVVLAVAYAAMLVPRTSTLNAFDRYLLVPIPIATAVTLANGRRWLAAATPGVAAWTTLAAFALVGTLATHDHFAELRVRDSIAASLASEGVPREQISNGLTFDGWTQLAAAGYVNDYRIVRPAGAFASGADDEARGKMFWFLPHTPIVRPRWIVVSAAERPRTLGDRRAFRYPMLLPPFEGWLLAWPVRGADDARAIDNVDGGNR